MSRRSHRFRATVEVPELGTVEVRGLSPDEFADLPFEKSKLTPEEIAAATHDHPIYVAAIVAGCVRPRLSDEQILALSPASRELLVGKIMRAHPAMRRRLPEETQQ